MARADGGGKGGGGGGNAGHGGRGHIDPCLTMDPDCFSLNVHIFTGERFKIHEVSRYLSILMSRNVLEISSLFENSVQTRLTN